MDFPRCKTCKHWVDRNETRERRRYYKLVEGEGLCEKMYENGFMLLDISGGPVYFDAIAKADFGCVEHEERK